MRVRRAVLECRRAAVAEGVQQLCELMMMSIVRTSRSPNSNPISCGAPAGWYRRVSLSRISNHVIRGPRPRVARFELIRSR